jgi:hypothetical protein
MKGPNRMVRALHPFESARQRTSNSARPTFFVDAETAVMFSRIDFVDREENVIVTGPPAFASAGTVTVVPSENVKVPPVIWSSVFGRS